MKKYLLFIGIFLFASIAISCKKKTKGICYCTFYGGAESEYDYRHLPRDQQKDSCAINDINAGNFAGSCKLK